DNTIYVIAQLIPPLVPCRNEGKHLLNGRATRGMLTHRKSPRFYRLETVPVVLKQSIAVITIQKIKKAVQWAAGHFSRVLKFDRTGSKVTGVGVSHLTIFNPFVVQALKRCPMHKNLSTDFKQIGIAL